MSNKRLKLRKSSRVYYLAFMRLMVFVSKECQTW